MGVQSDSQARLDIDPVFILSPEHRPKAKHCDFTLDQIPLIDLSPINSPTPPSPTTLDSLVTQIQAACRDWGFFQVINHGVSPQHLQTILSEAANFFALPTQEKSKVRRDFDNPLGYYDTELTKNVRDWKEVFDFTCRGEFRLPASYEGESDEILTARNQWPQNPPGLREACEKYAEAVEKLSFRLLELISLSLGLPARYFHSKFEDPTSRLRLNHYSACPAPELALGVGRHKDGGALTVLAQDEVGGLQVRRKDGEWIGVKPIPNSFVINVGDCMQVWSNDKYQSIEHRVVVNDKKERFSVPFFLLPSHYVMVGPVPELISEENPPRFKEFNWGKFFKRRRDSNFKNLGLAGFFPGAGFFAGMIAFLAGTGFLIETSAFSTFFGVVAGFSFGFSLGTLWSLNYFGDRFSGLGSLLAPSRCLGLNCGLLDQGFRLHMPGSVGLHRLQRA